MPLAPDTLIARADNLLSSELHDETVLLDVQQQKFYGFSLTSQAIWQKLAEPRSVRCLCDDLLAEYAADAPVIETDTLKFLDYLQENGLIVIVDPADEGLK